CASFSYRLRVFNLSERSTSTQFFAFIVKRFRVFRAPLHPAALLTLGQHGVCISLPFTCHAHLTTVR
ncbi:hypothetical protein ABLN79_09710, partial [Mycobacterium tuberculosis]